MTTKPSKEHPLSIHPAPATYATMDPRYRAALTTCHYMQAAANTEIREVLSMLGLDAPAETFLTGVPNHPGDIGQTGVGTWAV